MPPDKLFAVNETKCTEKGKNGLSLINLQIKQQNHIFIEISHVFCGKRVGKFLFLFFFFSLSFHIPQSGSSTKLFSSHFSFLQILIYCLSCTQLDTTLYPSHRMCWHIVCIPWSALENELRSNYQSY